MSFERSSFQNICIVKHPISTCVIQWRNPEHHKRDNPGLRAVTGHWKIKVVRYITEGGWLKGQAYILIHDQTLPFNRRAVCTLALENSEDMRSYWNKLRAA